MVLKHTKLTIFSDFCNPFIYFQWRYFQNIGSEDAAEGAAFMHSLVESCRMNGNPQPRWD